MLAFDEGALALSLSMRRFSGPALAPLSQAPSAQSRSAVLASSVAVPLSQALSVHPRATSPITAAAAAPPSKMARVGVGRLEPTPFAAAPLDEPIGLIDIGANLLDPMFLGVYHEKQKHEADLQLVLERAAAQGVEAIIVTAGSLVDAEAAQALLSRLQAAATSSSAAGARPAVPRLLTTVGVHPTNALEFGPSDETALRHVAALDALVDAGGALVCAVGELGLDYARLSFCPREAQLAGFERQLAIAERTGLPLFLHSRDAGPDMSSILRAHRHRFGDGVVHSFDGTCAELEDLLGLGLFVGLNGCSLRTEANLEAVRALPLERLMLETDAPWCEVRPTHAGFPGVRTTLPCAKKPDKFVWGQVRHTEITTTRDALTRTRSISLIRIL